MNIELVEFYPTEYRKEKRILSGTLRIKLSDLGIHILGIFVSKRNDSWFFVLPGKQAVDSKTNAKTRYPFIVFEDHEQQKRLIAAIREKAPPFIEKRLADIENPLTTPEKLKVAEVRTSLIKKVESEKLVASSFINKVWQDPPKRTKTTSRHRAL